MSKLRSVSTAFWSDPFIEDLTPSEKLLFLYLITNDKTNMLGIYEVSLKKMSYDTGLEKQVIESALKNFESLGKVKYLKNHIVLTNFMKHQNYNTNMKKSAIDVYNDLPNELKNNKLDINKNNPLESFQTLLNHYGMVSKVEYEYEYEVEYEYEKEKENFVDFSNQPPIDFEKKENDSLEAKEKKERKKVAPKKESNINYPFNSDVFIDHWVIWKEYKKKKHKFDYFDINSEQRALDKLKKLSLDNEQTAIAIIQQSIDEGWKGLLNLKNSNYGQNNSPPEQKQYRFDINRAMQAVVSQSER